VDKRTVHSALQLLSRAGPGRHRISNAAITLGLRNGFPKVAPFSSGTRSRTLAEGAFSIPRY
jgi:hypothetical protein